MTTPGSERVWLWLSVLATGFVIGGCGGTTAPDGEAKTEATSPDSPGVDKKNDEQKGGDASVDKNAEKNKRPQLPGEPVAQAPMPVATELLEEGWIALFDGQTLFGWNKNSDANWSVQDGAITVDSGERGLLTTAVPFANYQLRLEFKADRATNSGIFLRTPAAPTAPAEDCYELNIAPADNPFPTGSLVGREKVDRVEWNDQWRAYDVTVDGAQVTVKLDGETLLEYEDPKPLEKGFIGLQLNQGQVAFRNILLRPLGLQEIFNGEDLTGWTAPESPAVFAVLKKGELNVKYGRGHLETKNQYADFVLQFDCISHAKQLNSGLFFRCIPGSAMDGYESQIHNGFHGGDRRDPVDHGTGGIFRRQKARLVVADDLTWFHKTIVADGPTMAVWVNGYQVSCWTDDRPPHDNPRNGLRTEGGSLMIQGHDPTTNLSFRKLRIIEQ